MLTICSTWFRCLVCGVLTPGQPVSIPHLVQMFGLWSSHSWSTGINPTLGPDVWFVEFSLLVNRYQSHTWFRCLVCGVLTPGQPVSIPHLVQMFGLWSSHSWSTSINPTLGSDVWFVEFSLLVNRYQSHTWFRCLVCGVLTPGQPVSIPHLVQMFGLWSSHSWSTGINPTLGSDVWFVEFSLLVNRYQSQTWFRCLVCGVLTPGQPVSIPHLVQMFGLWSSHSWSTGINPTLDSDVWFVEFSLLVNRYLSHTWFRCLVCGVLTPGQPVSIPHLVQMFGLWSSHSWSTGINPTLGSDVWFVEFSLLVNRYQSQTWFRCLVCGVLTPGHQYQSHTWFRCLVCGVLTPGHQYQS